MDYYNWHQKHVIRAKYNLETRRLSSRLQISIIRLNKYINCKGISNFSHTFSKNEVGCCYFNVTVSVSYTRTQIWVKFLAWLDKISILQIFCESAGGPISWRFSVWCSHCILPDWRSLECWRLDDLIQYFENYVYYL